jgi:AcrR family transcriptional regulator
MPNTQQHRALSNKRERTHAAIIHAAITVIAEKNLGSASIDDLMQAAGMARATFYNYFQTREEVLTAVVEEIRLSLHLNVEQHIPSEASAEEIVASMMYGILQYCIDHPTVGLALVRLGGDIDWFYPYELSTGQFPRADAAILSLIKRDMPFVIIHTYIQSAVNTLLSRVLKQHIDRQNAEQLMALILRGIGIDEKHIDPSINTARLFAQQLHQIYQT